MPRILLPQATLCVCQIEKVRWQVGKRVSRSASQTVLTADSVTCDK